MFYEACLLTMYKQALDSDSTDEKPVLNRIVSLKEDAGKN